MAKWKLKASKEDIDAAGEQGEFVQAPVGYYVCVITGMTHGPNKDGTGTRAEVILKPVATFKDSTITSVTENYGSVWDYISDGESSGFKRAQFGNALGFKVKRGIIQEDVEMEAGKPGTVIGREVLVRLRKDTDQDGNYRPKIGAYLAKDALEGAEVGAADEESPFEDTEDTVEESDADGGEEPTWAEIGAAADEEDAEAIASLEEYAEAAGLDPNEYGTWLELAEALEAAEGEEGGDDAADGEMLTEESLTAMDREGLTAVAADFDLDIDEYIKEHKGKAKVQLIADILAAQGATDDEEPVEDPF